MSDKCIEEDIVLGTEQPVYIFDMVNDVVYELDDNAGIDKVHRFINERGIKDSTASQRFVVIHGTMWEFNKYKRKVIKVKT